MTERRKGRAAEPRPATVHPSSILRAPEDDARREEMRRFVHDVRTIARGIPNS